MAEPSIKPVIEFSCCRTESPVPVSQAGSDLTAKLAHNCLHHMFHLKKIKIQNFIYSFASELWQIKKLQAFISHWIY